METLSTVTNDPLTTVSNDIRIARVNHEQLAMKLQSTEDLAATRSLASVIDKFHDRFLFHRTCRLQWRAPPSYCDFSGITFYDLLESIAVETNDLAHLPSNCYFGHFCRQSSPSGVWCKPSTKWLPFRRRQCQMQFRQWQCMHFALEFNEVCSLGAN